MPNPTPPKGLKPSTIPGALAGTALCAIGFGALTALLPAVKLTIFALIAVAIVLMALHAGLRHALAANLGVALVSAALGVGLMWGTWLVLELGWDRFAQIVAMGPKGIGDTLTQLSNRRVTIRMGTSSTTHGPQDIRLAWWIETLTFALSPVLGALWSVRVKRRAAPSS